AHTAPANRQSSLYFLSSYCLRERNDVVWIVIAFIETIGTELDDLMSGPAQLFDQLFLQSKSTVIGGNPNPHIVSPSSYIRVLRPPFGSGCPRRCLVGENQGVVPLNPTGWNCHIALAQARERCNFVLSSYEPENAACAVKNRIRQRHPSLPLIDSS